ncbi:MAG: TPM domain-containing protein [Candidatus Izemoplasmatales bacterium]|nr:TPM domain-containing protein [Candidatus Izemoplasmatales bacterium]
MSKLIKIVLFLVIVVFGIISLFSGAGEYPRPTNEFYVNDFANVLLPGTRATIVSEGERLYELTEDETEGGAQIVIATFAVESIADIAKYNKTEIFRQWRIGKNDMGILVLLFFVEETTDDFTYLEFYECQIEPGIRMEQYLTPGIEGRIMDETIMSATWEDDLDMGVANLLYELLSLVYVDAYGYSAFNYDMEEFEDYLVTYSGDFDEDMVPMNLLMYLLSPYSSFWNKFSAILVMVLIGGFGGGALIANRGGGGTSGGMGVSRRRR